MFKTKQRKLTALLGGMVGSLMMLFAGGASAGSYLSPVVGTAFTDITADFHTLIDTYIWPLLILVLATFFIMKITKKGAGAAA